MKYIPILFSTPMVQAEQAGLKTQTRRTRGLEFINESFSKWEYMGLNDDGLHLMKNEYGATNGIKCPYGQPGDVLWVRETWQYYDTKEEWYVDSDEPFYQAGVLFKASNDVRPNGVSVEDFGCTKWINVSEDKFYDIQSAIEEMEISGDKWKPSIHMPKSACRTFLSNVYVTLQRLHDINETDALSEGMQLFFKNGNYRVPVRGNTFFNTSDVKKAYLAYVNSLNNLTMDDNPWVWVIDFLRTEKPENF